MLERHVIAIMDKLTYHSKSFGARRDEVIPFGFAYIGINVLDWSPTGLLDRVRARLYFSVGYLQSVVYRSLLSTWDDCHRTVDFETVGVFGAIDAHAVGNP